MLNTLRKAEYAELMILFFIQAAAMAIWFVPLAPILNTHGYAAITPFAFAASSLAAFISPLMFGAMADRETPPAKVLRGLAIATAIGMTLAGTAIHRHWHPWLVLGLIQALYLVYSPMFSISTALVLARLQDAKKEFGPIRALATIGWMAGALLVSALGLDVSAGAIYVGAIFWLAVALFTRYLPNLAVPSSAAHLSWRERLGLDALVLLKNRNHRVVFTTVMLLSIPLAGFYPFTPAHLRALGFVHTSAWMGLAQTTEIISMFAVGWLLLRWRIKWVVACGLGFGILRFALCALNSDWSLLAGISLHGASFTLVYVTAAIYLDQRVDAAWRTRAQALMTLMSGGVGSLIGYLGTGWWFAACTHAGATRWPIFWSGLSALVAGVLVYFLTVYRSVGNGKLVKAQG